MLGREAVDDIDIYIVHCCRAEFQSWFPRTLPDLGLHSERRHESSKENVGCNLGCIKERAEMSG